MIKFKSLNQSKHFLRVLNKKKLNTKYFTIFFEKNLNNTKGNDNKNLNISFVIKKNIGNAVTRNKIKRKLKAAVQKTLGRGFIVGSLKKKYKKTVLFCWGGLLQRSICKCFLVSTAEDL